MFRDTLQWCDYILQRYVVAGDKSRGVFFRVAEVERNDGQVRQAKVKSRNRVG